MADLGSIQATDPRQQAAAQPGLNESSSSAGELSRPPSFLWKTTLHASCPRCHHWHNQFKVRLSLQPRMYNRIRCAACSHALFGLGGNSSHISLLSRETLSMRSGSWASSVQACTDQVLPPAVQALISTSSGLSAPGSPAVLEQSRYRGSGTPATVRRTSPLTQPPLARPSSCGNAIEAVHEVAREVQDIRPGSAQAPERSLPASVPVRQPYARAESPKGTTKRFQPLRKSVKALLLRFGYTIQRIDRSEHPLGLATEVAPTAHAGVGAVSVPGQADASPPESTDCRGPNIIEGPELTGRGIDQEASAPEPSPDSRQAAAADLTPPARSSENHDSQLLEALAESKISDEAILKIRREKTEAANRRRKCECALSCHCKKRSSSTGATVPTIPSAGIASASHSSSASAASSEHCTPRPRSAGPSFLGIGRQFPTPQVSHSSLDISEEERDWELHNNVNQASDATCDSQATTLRSGQCLTRTTSPPLSDVPSEASTVRSRTDELLEEEGAMDREFEVDGESTPTKADSGVDGEDRPGDYLDHF